MPPRSNIQELKIGPFSGGINRYSDPAVIADNELVDCVNFDISLDGSLVSRPPWSLLYSEQEVNVSASAPECNQLIIGTGTFEAQRYIVINSTHEGSAASYIYYVDGVNAGTLAKIGDGHHSRCHRYANDLFLIPDMDSEGTGLVYDMSGGLVTTIADMPVGYTSCIYKDRLWISGRRNSYGVAHNSRLFFSDLADFSSWPSTNFYDINPGDGDAVNELAVYQDNIIIFKDNATYVLAYDTGPAQAVLQVINTDIGAMGPYCVDVYENSIFILKYNKVYEMSNYDFIDSSIKIPFEFDDTLPDTTDQDWKYSTWLRVVGDRVIVRFYNRLYVYHTRLRAWTRWESQDESIQYLGPITRLDNTNTNLLRGYNTYVACSALSRVTDSEGEGSTNNWNMYFKIFKMEDRYDLDNVENGEITEPFPIVDINLSMTTKQFDVGLSHRFKRLMHWGLDCYTGRNVTGTMYPFSVAYKVTWNQLALYQWSQLNTWDYPLTEVPSVIQEVTDASGVHVKFIRFPQSLRFRLLQFKIDMVTQGNTTDGPCYIYSLTAFIGAKQVVPKAVN